MKSSEAGSFLCRNNCLTELGMFPGYCSLVIFREVFFVSEGHRKPETYRANLCDYHKFCASRKRVAENGVNSNVSGGSAKSNKQWRFDNGIGVCYIEKQKRKEPAGACVTG